MTEPSKVPIEYGPDADDDDQEQLEHSAIQKLCAPFYLGLFLVWVALATIPVVFLYTIVWMNIDARERMEDTSGRP
jgi:hypothetical protein